MNKAVAPIVRLQKLHDGVIGVWETRHVQEADDAIRNGGDKLLSVYAEQTEQSVPDQRAVYVLGRTR